MGVVNLCVIVVSRSFSDRRWYCFNDQSVTKVSGRGRGGVTHLTSDLSRSHEKTLNRRLEAVIPNLVATTPRCMQGQDGCVCVCVCFLFHSLSLRPQLG